MNNKNAGFSLLELMVTLAIAGILLAVAVPSFTGMVRQDRIATEVNKMVGALNFSRSEAVKRSMPVVLCPVASPNSITCDGVDWNGWKAAIIDINRDGAYDANDELLQFFDPSPDTLVLPVTAGGNRWNNGIEFNAQGASNLGGRTFSICTMPTSSTPSSVTDCHQDAAYEGSRQITLNRTGRISINKEKAGPVAKQPSP